MNRMPATSAAPKAPSPRPAAGSNRRLAISHAGNATPVAATATLQANQFCPRLAASRAVQIATTMTAKTIGGVNSRAGISRITARRDLLSAPPRHGRGPAIRQAPRRRVSSSSTLVLLTGVRNRSSIILATR